MARLRFRLDPVGRTAKAAALGSLQQAAASPASLLQTCRDILVTACEGAEDPTAAVVRRGEQVVYGVVLAACELKQPLADPIDQCIKGLLHGATEVGADICEVASALVRAAATAASRQRILGDNAQLIAARAAVVAGAEMGLEARDQIKQVLRGQVADLEGCKGESDRKGKA